MVRTDSITACAIVKDERPYMLEWVAWYRLLGFDRILIYSNDCSDGTDRLLDAMQAEGLVEHRPWPSRPGHAPQQSAYADALRDCPTRWILEGLRISRGTIHRHASESWHPSPDRRSRLPAREMDPSFRWGDGGGKHG